MDSETRWECMTSCVFLNFPGLHFLLRIIGVVDGMPLLHRRIAPGTWWAHSGLRASASELGVQAWGTGFPLGQEVALGSLCGFRP